jgi:GNAT superfamily N-acetyltransferase
MNLVTQPTEEHMSQLLKWLKAEERETGEGFLCNWNVITATYKENKLLVVEMNSEAVALLSWWDFSPRAGIYILTVKPSLRCKGIGRYLASSFFDLLRGKGMGSVKIQCEPSSSEGFWASLGFSEEMGNLCERINGVPMQNLYMYKILHE